MLALVIEATLAIIGFVRLSNYTDNHAFSLAQTILGVIAIVLIVSAVGMFIAVLFNPNALVDREKKSRRVEKKHTTQE